jgi:hypothetical protein
LKIKKLGQKWAGFSTHFANLPIINDLRVAKMPHLLPDSTPDHPKDKRRRKRLNAYPFNSQFYEPDVTVVVIASPLWFFRWRAWQSQGKSQLEIASHKPSTGKNSQ